jgi:hypothetical protein
MGGRQEDEGRKIRQSWRKKLQYGKLGSKIDNGRRMLKQRQEEVGIEVGERKIGGQREEDKRTMRGI